MLAAGVGQLCAQEYNWAVGVRGGVTTSGISVKHNFDPANSLEGIVDFRHGFNVYGLYQRNIPVIGEGFNFFYGAGANIGSWADKFTIGIDGIVGLEYKIQPIPLAVSLDYKPNLNLTGHTGFHAADVALTLRVTF